MGGQLRGVVTFSSEPTGVLNVARLESGEPLSAVVGSSVLRAMKVCSEAVAKRLVAGEEPFFL